VRLHWSRAASWLALALAAALGAGSAAADPWAEPRAILEDAIEKRSAANTLRRFTLTVRSESGRSHTRRATVATKEHEGVLYVLGVFSYPADLRGTSFLTIDKPSGSDYFVYFPAFRRVRRVSAYQQSDPWFGTDLSIEDLERHDGSAFEILASGGAELEGEAVWKIVANPTYGSSYDRVTFFIAQRDHAILRAEYHRTGREVPSKVIEASREGMIARDGALVPRRLLCTNLDTRTQTEVVVDDVIFSPELQKEFFTSGTLELRSKLRFLD
jgi:uncharacterized protein